MVLNKLMSMSVQVLLSSSNVMTQEANLATETKCCQGIIFACDGAAVKHDIESKETSEGSSQARLLQSVVTSMEAPTCVPLLVVVTWVSSGNEYDNQLRQGLLPSMEDLHTLLQIDALAQHPCISKVHVVSVASVVVVELSSDTGANPATQLG